MRWAASVGVAVIISVTSKAAAGPPYTTDDPVGVNYGVVPDVQLHVITPLAYSIAEQSTAYGYGDTI